MNSTARNGRYRVWNVPLTWRKGHRQRAPRARAVPARIPKRPASRGGISQPAVHRFSFTKPYDGSAARRSSGEVFWLPTIPGRLPG